MKEMCWLPGGKNTSILMLHFWLLGTSSWVFGITDRSIASLADGYISAIDLIQLFTAAFFFVSWLFLKPEN